MTKNKQARTLKKSTQFEKIKAINNHKKIIKAKLMEKELMEEYLKKKDFTKSPNKPLQKEELQMLYNQINGFNLSIIKEAELGELCNEVKQTDSKINRDIETEKVDKRMYIYYLKIRQKKEEIELLKKYAALADWKTDPRKFIISDKIQMIINEIQAEETFINAIIQIPKLKIEIHEMERKMRDPNAKRSRNLPVPKT